MSTGIHSRYSSSIAITNGGAYRGRPALKFGSAATAIKTTATNLKLATSRRALNISEKIVETFLWSFLALDVLGMWMPRIKVSLTRGAIPYDVRKDPEMKGKSLSAQNRKSIKENIKGLNWTNLYEEAGREFATGPGMLIVPTLIYLLAKRAPGGQAIRMSSKQLTEHGVGFAKHLASVAPSDILNQAHIASPQARYEFLAAYRNRVKEYLKNVFKDDDFFSYKTTEPLKEYRNRLPAYKRNQLNALLPLDQVKTGEAYLDQWFKLWVERHIHPGRVPASANRTGRDEMEVAYAELHDLFVDKFNECYQLGKKLEHLRAGKPNISLDVTESSNVTINGRKQSLGAFLGGATQGELDKLGHFFSAIAGERLAGKKGHISDVSTGMLQRVGALKTIQYAAAFLSALYVATLVKFTQKHDVYPGERLAHLELPDDSAKHREKHDIKEHQQVSRLAYAPLIFASAKNQNSPFQLPNRQEVSV